MNNLVGDVKANPKDFYCYINGQKKDTQGISPLKKGNGDGVVCKLLEHIVCSNIMAHLDEHKLLSDKQHTFRKWHSSET